MRPKQFKFFNSNKIKGEDLAIVNAFKPQSLPHPSGQCADCCPFLGGGYVVVDLSFYVPPMVCGGSMFGLSFVIHYLMSFLVLQSY